MALADELYEIAEDAFWYDILDTDELAEKYQNHSGQDAKMDLDNIIDCAVRAATEAAQDAIWSELVSRRHEVIDDELWSGIMEVADDVIRDLIEELIFAIEKGLV